MRQSKERYPALVRRYPPDFGQEPDRKKSGASTLRTGFCALIVTVIGSIVRGPNFLSSILEGRLGEQFAADCLWDGRGEDV